MNREIKFRAFQYGVMLYSETSGVYGAKRFLDRLYEDCALMQYTGLKDKNGKEIYEGDILECHLSTIGERYNHIGLYKVIFDKASFKIQRIKFILANNNSSPKLLRIGENRQNKHKFIIKGNIHENPELLEKS